MNDLYKAACSVKTIPPMNYYNWKQWHEWPYRTIADHIVHDETIIDVGAGCGFLSMHLLMTGKCDRILAYDTRENMCEFMSLLSNVLGLATRLDVRCERFQSNQHDNLTVSTRLGFSNLLLNNRVPTITMARTNECEPILKYVETPNGWNEKVVTRDDGFNMRLLWNYQQ